MNQEREREVTGLTSARIETLTDGIFAIAMTLLVLNLALPEVSQGLSSGQIHRLLLEQQHKFFNYALSFVLLAVFWIIHHQQFHFIRRTDRPHIWINIFLLMFIALVPFTTSLIGDFPDDWLADLFFAVNLFAIGALFELNWWYAAAGRRLVDSQLSLVRFWNGLKRGAVTPLVALLAIILACVRQPTSLIYLAIPLVRLFPWFGKE